MANILFIDDEPDIVYLIKKVLEKAGHTVDVAYNGEDGMKKAREEKPDLVLLDIMMPDVSGWDVSRTLKTSNDTQDIPIVMLTVRTSQDSVRKSIGYAFADAHIGKPASGKEIVETIAPLLG